MDAREILIANTKTQKRYNLTTDATTLAELKAAMDAADIDYEGLTFTEGISKTQLISDDTQLPQNVMYKGEPTNNLVILLTNTKKNIASGEGTRQEAYAIIKDNNLQDIVKVTYGKNYTVVPSTELWKIIDENVEKESADAENLTPEESLQENSDNNILDSLFNLIVSLESVGQISMNDISKFINRLDDYIDPTSMIDKNDDEDDDEPADGSYSTKTSDGKIDDDDIDDMLDDLGF